MREKQLVRGQIILQRLEQHEIPSGLRALVRDFRDAQNRLVLAMSGVETAKQNAAEALEAVHNADAALDRGVKMLAARMVGAEMGPASNPFTHFSRYTPAQMQRLGYATEVKEVRKLAARIRRRKPPTEVERAIDTCLDLARNVENALSELAQPQARQQRALQARESATREWQQQLQRLRLHAAAAWANEPSVFRALFAPPPSVVRPSRGPRKRRRATP